MQKLPRAGNPFKMRYYEEIELTLNLCQSYAFL